MSINNEDEFGTRPAAPEEMQAWEAENIRGVRARFSGVRVDSRGNRMNELTVIDDEFNVGSASGGFATPINHAANCGCAACVDKSFKYINWHQKSHRHIPDARCMICQKEQEFRKQHPELVGKRVGVNS